MIELATERLVMRPHQVTDFNECAAMWADPAVTKHIAAGKQFSASEVWSRLLRYAGHWSLMGFGFWAVRERATDAFVGDVGMMEFGREIEPALRAPECGWVLAAWAHGKGYATEAVRATVEWADGRFPRTTCIIDPDNEASIHVATKVGFRPTGTAMIVGEQVRVFERERP